MTIYTEKNDSKLKIFQLGEKGIGPRRKRTMFAALFLLVSAGYLFGLLGLAFGLVLALLARRYRFENLTYLPVYIKNLLKILFDIALLSTFCFGVRYQVDIAIYYLVGYVLSSFYTAIYREPLHYFNIEVIIKTTFVSFVSVVFAVLCYSIDKGFALPRFDLSDVVLLFLIGLTPILYRAFLIDVLTDENYLGNESQSAVLFVSPENQNRLEEYARLLESSGYSLLAFVGEGKRYFKRSVYGIPFIQEEELGNIFPKGAPKLGIMIKDQGKSGNHDANQELLRASGFDIRSIPDIRQSIVEGALSEKDLPRTMRDILSGEGDPVEDTFEDISAQDIDRCVLVTGGAGSIGSVIVDSLLKYGFRKILLVDNSERNIYELSEKYQHWVNDARLCVELIDVNDVDAMAAIFARHNPDTVFHAAALKHVPIVEENAEAAYRVNIKATIHLLELVRRHVVKNFCFISTDKAVEPTSIMGASKRIGELLIEREAISNPQCFFNVVRFGNVIASSGSALPIFARQIREGKNVTITHPGMTRYFMTLAAAAKLVITGTVVVDKPRGESSLFVLDMGKAHKIKDLVEKMAAYSGKRIVDNPTAENEIGIEYTGIRPGEKLEESLTRGESMVQTEVPGVLKVNKEAFSEGIARIGEELSGLTEERQEIVSEWLVRVALA